MDEPETRDRLRDRLHRARLDRRKRNANPLATGEDPDPPDWFRPEPLPDDLPADEIPAEYLQELEREQEGATVSPVDPLEDGRLGGAVDDSEPEQDAGAARDADDSGELPFGGGEPYLDWRVELRERLKKIRARKERESAVAAAAAQAEDTVDAAMTEDDGADAGRPDAAGDPLAAEIRPGSPAADVASEPREDEAAAAEEPEPEPVAAEAPADEPESEPEPVAAEEQAEGTEPEPVAIEEPAEEPMPEAEPVASEEPEPEPEPVAAQGPVEEPMPEAEPVAAEEQAEEPEPEPEPVAAQDRVEEPERAPEPVAAQEPAEEPEPDPEPVAAEAPIEGREPGREAEPVAAEEPDADEWKAGPAEPVSPPSEPPAEDDWEVELEPASEDFADDDDELPVFDFEPPHHRPSADQPTAGAPAAALAEDDLDLAAVADDAPAMKWDTSAEPPPAAARPGAVHPSAGPLGSRTAAALCDGLVLLSIALMLVGAASSAAGVSVGEVLTESLLPLALAWSIFAVGYSVFFVGTCGQTIGRMVMRLRVVSTDRFSIGFGRATQRLGAYLLSVLPVGLGFLPAVGDPQRRALHDRLTRTRVVRS